MSLLGRLFKGPAPGRLPRPLRALARRAVEHLPVSRDNFSFDFKARRFVHGAEYPAEHRH